MSIENARKYFQMVATDEDFLNAIIDSGEDEEKKAKLLHDYGLDFTKAEFDQAVSENLGQYEKSISTQ